VTEAAGSSSTPDTSLQSPTGSIRSAGRLAWAIIGLLIITAVVVAGFAYTRSVSVPILLAFVLAIVFQPFVDWLVKKGLSRGLAAAIVLIGLILVIIGVIALVAATVVANWDEISSDLSEAASEVDDLLSNTSLSDNLGTETKDSADSSGSTLATGAGSGVASAFNSAAGIVAGLFLGLWIAYYVLQGGYVEDESADEVATTGWKAKWTELVDYGRTSIRGYYTSQTVLGVFDGTLIGLSMVVLGVPGALSVAVVNVIGSYIPYIGAFVGGGLAVMLALAEGGTTLALIMLAIVLLVQNTLENIVQPRVTAKYVSLSPLAVLLATALGGVVAGLVGLVLAVPFTAVLFKAVDLARRTDEATPTPAADDSS
jgi:predicted PurR-regulated permease PerM